MITVKNNLFTKLSVNSIYTFPKETTNEDITNTVIHDIVLGLYGLIKEYGKNLKVNDLSMSKFNTFKYVWSMDDNKSTGWECIYKGDTKKRLIDIILSEIEIIDSKYPIGKEIINNIFPEDKHTVFHIFKNDKLDNSHIFATYNILCYGTNTF
jgi:hypothetical protein